MVRSGNFDIKSFTDGRPFREQSIPFHQMIIRGADYGVGANFCLFYYAQRYAHVMTEPAHSHDNDMWIINLSGDALNPEELNAEIEMWWGEENQKLAFDTPTVCHVVPGMVHRSIEYRRIDKPFIQIHTYNSLTGDAKSNVFVTEGGFNLPEGVKG